MKGCCTWSKGADKDLNWRGRLSSLFLGYSPLTGTCRLLTCCRDAKVSDTRRWNLCEQQTTHQPPWPPEQPAASTPHAEQYQNAGPAPPMTANVKGDSVHLQKGTPQGAHLLQGGHE